MSDTLEICCAQSLCGTNYAYMSDQEKIHIDIKDLCRKKHQLVRLGCSVQCGGGKEERTVESSAHSLALNFWYFFRYLSLNSKISLILSAIQVGGLQRKKMIRKQVSSSS